MEGKQRVAILNREDDRRRPCGGLSTVSRKVEGDS